ncbi:hypothetical protein [Streptomyces candidus]|uniref:Uncharacterized protein n=1 Tax=Streptomyces candidus TaxID=67283 RepID=A0A7X0HGQ5_9ACTN|nr:hypothetical protein [Streptomyces candidus]MBB6435997.1 hypothetical protein [Streptomyces candidus]GHH43281.1 hypothetical protein GCM10018773_29010 [Streptomyces candidus]
MEQSSTSTPLTGAVQGLASELASALRSGGRFRLAAGIPDVHGAEANAGLALAAVRVVGADAVLPSVLRRAPAEADDLALFGRAVHIYPPAADASPVSVWSHWAMKQTLRRLDAPSGGGSDRAAEAGPEAEPQVAWLADVPWQVLTHQLALLAPLAVPEADCAVADVARDRPVDVARGFVRAVRRRDWLQAAGAGRWLVLLDGVPATLGLGAGLEFVAHMGGDDPRVALQVEAARHLQAGARP